MYDIIIIGAGPAGLTAALYSLRSGKSVLVLERESFGGQITLTPMIENYPATGKISGMEFADTLVSQVTDLGGDIEFSNVLEVIDGKTKKVITEDGEYEGKAIIIASGVRHRRLGIEREAELVGKGVSYCAICDGAFYKNKVVTVVGGGSTALTDALYLSSICTKVYLIHRRDTFRGEGTLVERVKACDNIELILNSNVTSLYGDGILNKIGVTNTDGKTSYIDTDALFIMIGQQPDNGIFQDVADLDDGGFIKANDDLSVKADGFFVAGDCRKKEIRQLTTATADGTIAAISACKYIDNNL